MSSTKIEGDLLELTFKVKNDAWFADNGIILHVLDMRDQLFIRIAELTKLELVRIHEGTSNSKAGMLYLNILAETKTMVLQSRNLLKSQRYYMEEEGKPMRRPVARM